MSSSQAQEGDAGLLVGQPVKVMRAGQWLPDFAEVFRANPDGTFHVLVKPGVEQLGGTVPDKKDVEFGCGMRHQWYILKEKTYPSEVREYNANDDAEMNELVKYEEYLERDSMIKKLVLDEEKLRKSTTVIVARHSGNPRDPRPSSPADNNETFKQVLVHLTLTWPIVPAMTKVGGEKYMTSGVIRSGGLVHNKDSKGKLKKKKWLALKEAIETDTSWKCEQAFVGGAPLIEDAEIMDPGKRWSHEIQRAVVWSVDNGLPIVVIETKAGKYDDAKWNSLAKRSNANVATNCCHIV